jgi:hypothetical protein
MVRVGGIGVEVGGIGVEVGGIGVEVDGIGVAVTITVDFTSTVTFTSRVTSTITVAGVEQADKTRIKKARIRFLNFPSMDWIGRLYSRPITSQAALT